MHNTSSQSFFARIATLSAILLCVIFAGRWYWQPGVPLTHDGENHLARFANYKVAVRELQVPPRFAPNLFNHYGYPVFNFNYPLANMLAVTPAAFKVHYELIFKLIMVGGLAFGLWGGLRWLRLCLLGTHPGWWAVMVIGSAPYCLSLFWVRGSIGELLIIAFLPWVFSSIEEMRQQFISRQQWGRWFLVWTGLSLAHNIGFIFSLPLVFSYAAMRFGLMGRFWRRLVFVLLVMGGLSAWFWLPALMEKEEVIVDAAAAVQAFTAHFPTWNQLWWSPFTMGYSYPGTIDSISVAIGWFQWWLLVGTSLVMISYILRRKTKSLESPVVWSVAVSWVLIVAQLPSLRSLWMATPLVAYIQFPWRLSLFLPIVLLPLASWAEQKLPRWWRMSWGLLLLLQLIVLSRYIPTAMVHHDRQYYDEFSQSTTTANENLPRTFTYLDTSDWQPAPHVLSGEAVIRVDKWKGSWRHYQVTAYTPVTLSEPTMLFSGWQTSVKSSLTEQSADNHRKWLSSLLPFRTNVAYETDERWQGRIVYKLPVGTHDVRTRFTQWTVPRIVGNTTSLMTLLGVSSWLSLRHFKKRFSNDSEASNE